MAYCTVADIEQRYATKTFTSSTTVTTEDVQDFIDDNTALIDARLNSVATTPLTNAQDLKVVKKICVFMTLADIEPILNKPVADDGKERKVIDYGAKAEKLLSSIISGEIAIIGNESLSSELFHNSNIVAGREPTIKKDCEQW